MTRSFSDEESGETFRYSSFPWIQGRLLRGAIKYLAAVDAAAVSDKPTLLEAGVPLCDTISDSAELSTVVSEALVLLNSWLREPSESQKKDMFRAKGPFGTPSVLESEFPLSDIQNTPFFIEKVAEADCVCPPCLERLGLGGLFLCMDGEGGVEVSSGGAKEIVDVLDRLEPYIDWEGWEDVEEDDSEDESEEGEGDRNGEPAEKETKTPGQQMRVVFAACAANPESSIS
ncbi:hypothetical protein K438DRAFT_1832201 [Mycena galopus ATCC 62051]|nr:hypothetical protein K438DRAFT_1832201 [Mycena galopus ATCC 62051]